MPTSLVSAGLLLYRRGPAGLEVLLGHPGGPFYRNKDDGTWTIPKGAPDPGEELSACARREFLEEVGLAVAAPLIPLGEIRQKAGKAVHAFAAEGDLPPGFVPVSNTFEMEWPPRSGRHHSFPEIDRVAWFSPDLARTKLNAAQAALLDRLTERLGGDVP